MNNEKNKFDRIISVLMLTVNFISGASIMIVEITGARLIAPIVGNSIYSWTALIAIVLIFLAIGGWIGGYLADKNDGHGTLAVLLALGAATVLLISPVSSLTFSHVFTLGLISGPVFLSLMLFALPALLQGMISPLATRIISRGHHDRKIGLSAGQVNALGALGSFFGTFVAGFYLVPKFHLQTILGGVGYVLLGASIACAIIYFLLRQKNIPIVPLTISLVTVAVSITLHHGIQLTYSDNIRLTRQSPYHSIQVLDIENDDGRIVRELSHDSAIQGSMYLDSDELPRRYQRSWKLSEIYMPQGITSSFFVGGGSFSIPKALHQQYPDANITVAEIDPAVVKTGQEWFGLDEYNSISVVTEDARRYLASADTSYDFIYLDAYNGRRQIPAHLVTQEFFDLVSDHLNPGGLVMINLIASVEEPFSDVFDAVHTTLETVFDHIDVYIASDEEYRQNEVLNLTVIASKSALGELKISGHDVTGELSDLLSSLVPKSEYADRSAPLLTDNLNPIDSLIAKSLRYSAQK